MATYLIPGPKWWNQSALKKEDFDRLPPWLYVQIALGNDGIDRCVGLPSSVNACLKEG